MSTKGTSRVFQLMRLNWRGLSTYQQEATHKLQGDQSSILPEMSLYNETEVRHMLSEHRAGAVDLRQDADGIGHLTLRNEAKRNAISGSMMLELRDAVEELERWHDGRAVVVRGAAGHFCAGGDFDTVRQLMRPVDGAKLTIFMQTTMARLRRLPLLSVARLEGHALGGGAELAVACDLRVAAPDARVGFVQARLGVSTGWAGGTHLRRIVGYRRALELLASGRTVDAVEALSLGLAECVVKGEDEWLGWWQRFAASETAAMRAAKQIVLNASEASYAESLNRERDIFSSLWGGKVHQAAIDRVSAKTNE